MADQGKTIVIAMDGSRGARDAFQFYCNMLRKKTDTVIMVHAVEPYNAIFAKQWYNAPYSMHGDELKGILEEEAKDLELRLQNYADMMKKANVGGRVRSIHTEKTGKGILDIAEEVNATCIVMGTRGMGTLRRTVLGSVSDYVVHHSKMPVFIVPESKDK